MTDAMLLQLLAALPHPIAIYGAQGELLHCNAAWQTTVEAALPTQATRTLTALWQSLGLNQATMPGSTATIQIAEQGYTLSATPMHPTATETWQVLTLLAQATPVQTQQQERISRFLGHHLRTPVAAIISLTRAPSSKNSAAQVVDPRIAQVLQQANAMLHMLDDFNLSLIADAGNYVRKEESVETLVDDAVGKVEPLARQKNQTLDVQLSSTMIFVPVQSRLLIRALVYLLTQAVELAGVGATIGISAQISTGISTDISTDMSTTINTHMTLSIHAPLEKMSTTGNTAVTHQSNYRAPTSAIGVDFVQTVMRLHGGSFVQQENVAEEARQGELHTRITLPCTVHH